jgi:hypothetical protein
VPHDRVGDYVIAPVRAKLARERAIAFAGI